MKTYIYVFLSVIAAVSMFCACDIETSDAGKFEGMWHLVRIDTLATGGVHDMSRERVYWSFQYKLMEADDRDNRYQSVLMRYSRRDGVLTLTNPFLYDREGGDKPINDETEKYLLTPYGINGFTEDFQIVKVTGSKMQLQSSMLRLSFKKF